MEAQTVTWFVFLALIKHVSTSDPTSPFELESGVLPATEGSCIEIKSQVTRDVDVDDAYWFWMKDRLWVEKDNDYTSTVIYSTNNSTRPVSPDFANRVKYIGSSSSSWKNANSAWPKPLCSILICDLRRNDSGKYSLRFVGQGKDRWKSEEVTLNVTENRCPLTFKGPAVVVESNEVTLTCNTSSSCPSRPHIQDVTQIDQTQVTGSHQDKERTTFSFRARRQDDGRVFSCQTQDNKDKYLIQNITVTVKYSPKHVTVQVNPGLDVKENVSLTLSCSAESNPPVSSVTWRKTTDGREEIIQQTQTQTFRVNSASPSDSGLYSCEATNDIGSGKSQPAEVKVRFSLNHTHITESAEKQELDGRSSVMLSCFSHSFPPVQHYSWYRKSQGEEKDELVSEHQNHTVYSNQSGVYYCVAQNEEGQRLSDPVHLFEPTGNYLENLRFLVVALFLLMIISVIVVNLRNWRKKSIQQGTTNTKSPSGFSEEPESLQDYDDVGNATARAPTSPNLLDDHTSEGEVELNFPQVRFTATPRRQTTNRDSSSSHQDESLYSNVRI
ncbi:B-cell receptor CD22 isoform X2 [Pleuronectes platessa]|uniref:B-cell receptor CD22 isoform X2 n=1 Tax=Pleuronectes platessa TaxID=8262 RepID=UPI00232A1262|nr:B-cell receptor CD22 isoform X2 [Pleuronectes platessa]